MKKQLLSNILGAILLTAICAASLKAATNRTDEATLYKFKEAGIQFTVPTGWAVEVEESAVKVSPKAGGMAQVAFIALPIATDISADDRHDLFDRIVEKSKPADARLGDYVDNETMGGMHVTLRPYEGTNNGHHVQGMYFLLNAQKLVSIVLVIDKAAGDALSQDAETIINSVKKIE
ncbi:MAG TPA: hypothetical protein VKA60_13920 [Blastocatellia bacterium]|nr:hypothetical protein [Blastocatellia bacterium]